MYPPPLVFMLDLSGKLEWFSFFITKEGEYLPAPENPISLSDGKPLYALKNQSSGPSP